MHYDLGCIAVMLWRFQTPICASSHAPPMAKVKSGIKSTYDSSTRHHRLAVT